VDRRLLQEIDRYLDAAPRAAARAEAVGPFTLFVREGPGWPYYARPTPGVREVEPKDVEAVRVRQRELGIPEAFEWIEDLVPGVGDAARITGLEAHGHPMMHLPTGTFRPAAVPGGFAVRMVGPDDRLDVAMAVARIGFGAPGVEPGPVGPEALDDVVRRADPAVIEVARDRHARGLTVTAAAFANGVPVSIGSHQPVGDATEIVGVATLPAFRRRGLGGAVTSRLVEDALSRGTATVFLSAGDETIARVYTSLGFVRVGTAGAAEPPPSPGESRSSP
jgi:ribosomal protein S18 acetylase RimI-like enzyme